MPLIDNVFDESLTVTSVGTAGDTRGTINPPRVSALAGSQYEYLPWDARIEIGALMTANHRANTTDHTQPDVRLSVFSGSDLLAQDFELFPLGTTFDLSVLRTCLLYTSPSPRDRTRSRMPSSA